MRDVTVRTVQADSEEEDRSDRLVKLLATGLERLLSRRASGDPSTSYDVDFSASLSPNRHAPDDEHDGEHLD